jgi:hypothetical protein
MSLHNKIANELKKTNLDLDITEQSLANLALFSISQDSYFNNNYNFLTLAKNKENELFIYQPYLSYIRGFTNQRAGKDLISVFIPKEKVKKTEEEDDEDDYDDNYNDFSDINKIYLNDYILENLNTFVDIIENNNTIQELEKAILKENSKNKEFIHIIERYISSEFNNEREPVQNLFKFLSNNIKLGNNKQNTDMHSEVYYNNQDNFYPDSFLYRDVLDCYGLKDLIMQNKLKALNTIKKDPNNSFSKFDLITIYKDDQLKKCPDDILEMIQQEKSKKEIYKSFKSKYNSENLNIALSFKSPKEKENDIINKRIEEIKGQYVNTIKNFINDKFENINTLSNKLEQVKPFVEKVKSNFSEFSNNAYTIEVNHTNPIDCRYGTMPLYKEVLENQKLLIYNNHNVDFYTKGLEMADEDSFKAGSSHKKVFFIARTENEIIGMLSCTLENNSMNICNISVSNYKRNQKVMSKLYDTMTEYAVANNRVICNSMYTDSGAKYIPSVKNKIMQNNKNVLFLDEDAKNLSGFEYELIQINRSIKRLIKTNENKINITKFRAIYDDFKVNFKKDFDQVNKDDYSAFHDLKTKILIKLENDINSSFSKNLRKKHN